VPEEVADLAEEVPSEEPSLAVPGGNAPVDTEARAPKKAVSAKTASSKGNGGNSSMVTDLTSWTNPQRSGLVLGICTLFWYTVTFNGFTVVSVFAWLALAVLAVAFCWVQYVQLSAKYVRGTTAENPFVEHFGEKNFEVDREMVIEAAGTIAEHVNALLRGVRMVFFCEDAVTALKWAAIFWLTAKIGGWFSLVTLLYIPVLVAFSWPPIYAAKHKEIDQALAMAQKVAQEKAQMVVSKLPPQVQQFVPAQLKADTAKKTN
jgi:Reticulon